MSVVIEISGLNYSYPGTDLQVLKDINLTVEDGEFVLLVGPSGSGKSTLLQTLNGIIPKVKGGQLSGRIVVNGLDVAEHEIARMAEHISMVFQDPESQLTSVFVLDEVAFGPENFKLERAEILRRVDSALHYVGLPNTHDRYVYELSGGQQQRLAISSVLAIDSKVLVLDDPTANLDPVGTAEVLNVLKHLREEGRTVILATHWLDEFIHLATKLIVLDDGAVFACGEPREVLDKYGAALAEEMGIWVPELVEVEMALRRKRGVANGVVPLTVEEALEKYKTFSFDPTRFEPLIRPREGNGGYILEGTNLAFTYPDGTNALYDISFKVKDRSLTGILGPNGAGKSTLASIIVGLQRLREGQLTFRGESVKDMNVDQLARRMGFVFQNPEHQFVRDTVRDEIAYSLEVLGKSPEEIQSGVDEMLTLLKLKHLEHRHPFGLSGGEKRRLSVAVMLVSHPELLILDEPTYGQDRNHVRNIMKLVQAQLDRGVTVLIITHQMRLIEEYVEDVLILNSGRVLYQGPPEDMFAHLGDQRDVTLREPHLQRLIRHLRTLGKDIHPHTRTVQELVDQIVLI
ncbi:MAG: energy-coupling factor transporter ATPase [Chloroflexi bacterium]|nr:energy-coupling factor transporter ATPase [Chloroflexota bacterium]